MLRVINSHVLTFMLQAKIPLGISRCLTSILCLYNVRVIEGLSVQSDGSLTLLHSERPKLCAILAFLSAIGLTECNGINITFYGPREISYIHVQAWFVPNTFPHGN